MTAFDRIVADADENGFVNFGDVARQMLNMQSQYASYYVGGLGERPDLSGGLRFKGDPASYHSLRIHKDDVEEFIARVQNARAF